MTRVSFADNGWMAAVMGPLDVIEKTLASIDGYVVIANINSGSQAVIGGETQAVQRAMEALDALGLETVRLPVSHAFHTRIVAPAAGAARPGARSASHLLAAASGRRERDRRALPERRRQEIRDLLVEQIASPVQWVRGLETLWREGVRTFVEVGPKKALKGFVDDVLGGRDGLVSLFTNHPKVGEIAAFNQALCGLFAAGHGVTAEPAPSVATMPAIATTAAASDGLPEIDTVSNKSFEELAQVLGRGRSPRWLQRPPRGSPPTEVFDRNRPPAGSVVITGCGLGLPGPEKPVMDPQNVDRILRGEQLIDLLPVRFRERMARKHVTRVVKTAEGDGRFETIDDTADVLKLAGRAGPFDLAAEYGVPREARRGARHHDAARHRGGHRRAARGRHPARPDLAAHVEGHLPPRPLGAAGVDARRDRRDLRLGLPRLRPLRRGAGALLHGTSRDARGAPRSRSSGGRPAIRRRCARSSASSRRCDDELRREPYAFDRRFLLRVLPMGHSQFAEYIGARGPNTLVNAACASTAQAIAMAEDWIRSGRCRRVVVIAADNPTSDNLLEWIGAGFLGAGAAATDDKVEEAAIPFDRRRHGMIVGMGAAALVVESQDAVEERGMRGIVELLSSETRNSAFHATRLDVDHIAGVVESLVRSAERRFGLDRRAHGAGDGLHVARDVHAGPRRERVRRGRRPAAGVRGGGETRSSSRTPRGSPATPWASASRT